MRSYQYNQEPGTEKHAVAAGTQQYIRAILSSDLRDATERTELEFLES